MPGGFGTAQCGQTRRIRPNPGAFTEDLFRSYQHIQPLNFRSLAGICTNTMAAKKKKSQPHTQIGKTICTAFAQLLDEHVHQERCASTLGCQNLLPHTANTTYRLSMPDMHKCSRHGPSRSMSADTGSEIHLLIMQAVKLSCVSRNRGRNWLSAKS